MTSAMQASIWEMVKAREQQGGKKHDAQIMARAKTRKRNHHSTFPGRHAPGRLPSLPHTMRGTRSLRKQREICPSERSLQRAGKLQELIDSTFPSHDPYSQTPIFAGQQYLLAQRKKHDTVKVEYKYLKSGTVRSLPCWTNNCRIEKSLEQFKINDAFLAKCGFHQNRAHCLYTEFLCFLGPQMHRDRDPRMNPKDLFKLFNARGIVPSGDASGTWIVQRALEALSKPEEGADVSVKTFYKLMEHRILVKYITECTLGIIEGSARKLAAKTFFKVCDPTRQRAHINPIELLRLITEGLPKSHRPLVGVVLAELLDQLGLVKPEELEYDKFVTAVVNDDSAYELFQALNPFARLFAKAEHVPQYSDTVRVHRLHASNKRMCNH